MARENEARARVLSIFQEGPTHTLQGGPADANFWVKARILYSEKGVITLQRAIHHTERASAGHPPRREGVAFGNC